VAQLFRRSSDGKINVQSACALNTRYERLQQYGPGLKLADPKVCVSHMQCSATVHK
jgi:hypothetical protein